MGILTRPLGAALGDLLAQAQSYGGLGIGATTTSVLFLTVIVVMVALAQRNAPEGSVTSPSRR